MLRPQLPGKPRLESRQLLILLPWYHDGLGATLRRGSVRADQGFELVVIDVVYRSKREDVSWDSVWGNWWSSGVQGLTWRPLRDAARVESLAILHAFADEVR